MISFSARLRQWARSLKQQILMLYCALRDPGMPVFTRWLAMVVVAYALSPIDLIPDVIPVLGYLDDVILLPVGIWLVIRMTPPEVIERARQQATLISSKPVNKRAAVVIVMLWIITAVLLAKFLWPYITSTD